MDRRKFIQMGGVSCLAGALPPALFASLNAPSSTLTTSVARSNILGSNYPDTEVWGFNGTVPGSPLRITLGDRVDLLVDNQLSVPTSVHWHGIRLPNAMDGVAGLTQEAILPEKSFRYTFTPPDAGTFWYHAHLNSPEQVGRGLYGPLIIEEQKPPQVDRDLVWMIDDWRLQKDGSISDDFGTGMDMSHAGRIGNVPTVNGRYRDSIKVRKGERLRLRLINSANARTFALNLEGLAPMIIAIDGQPVKPYQADGPIVIGAAGRVDVIVDMMGDPDSESPVIDTAYRDSFQLARFIYDAEPLRNKPLESAIELPSASLPEPDLANAVKQDVIIGGGAMGGLRKAILNGKWVGLRDIAQQGYVWAINDTVANKLDMPPLIEVAKGTTVKFTIENQTAFSHPMHLHGHHMKILTIDGRNVPESNWVDTPLILPKQRVELAFVADNPGNWLFHCHALEHHAAGLGALVSIT